MSARGFPLAPIHPKGFERTAYVAVSLDQKEFLSEIHDYTQA
jgi:hypothetical protein